MNQYYEQMYENEMDFNNLKNIKNLAPLKRIKKELVKKYCRGNSILELGCGLGEYISMFNKEIYGSDIALNALKKAKIFCPSGKFFQANAEDLPLKKESFDCVILPDVLEHVQDYESLLNELARVVKNNGRIIIITHASNKYENREYEKINLWTNVMGEGGDLRGYGLNLVDKLSDKGFKVVTIRYLGGSLTKNLNKIETMILKRKGYDRSDIQKGKIYDIKNIRFYSKVLYLFYKLDYFIFGRRKGKFLFLVMDKK